jgi:hypothetical protein
MLSCKQISHLLSESQDTTLPVHKRWQLKLHLLMCSGCKNANDHLYFLRVASQRYPLKR